MRSRYNEFKYDWFQAIYDDVVWANIICADTGLTLEFCYYYFGNSLDIRGGSKEFYDKAKENGLLDFIKEDLRKAIKNNNLKNYQLAYVP